MQDFYFANEQELAQAWAMIARTFGNETCEERDEVWQYMGSSNGEHEFRHRCYRGKRTLASVVGPIVKVSR